MGDPAPLEFRSAAELAAGTGGSAIQGRGLLLSRLRRAVDEGTLTLAYQPQVEVDSAALCGLEALVRWCDPELGPVPPAIFIPLAEEAGLIGPLGALVLRRACAQMAAWRRDHDLDVPVAVNLSARQLAEPQLARMVLDTLAAAGLPPSALELELTETALYRSLPEARAALVELAGAGVRLLLDDFGTGYSSLSHLRRFPIHGLKVDRSFVQTMVDDADSAAIVRAIITMAQALRLRAIAEGVETPEEWLFLRAYRCDAAQGYLFSPPLDAAGVEDYLRRHTPDAARMPQSHRAARGSGRMAGSSPA